MDQKPLIKKKKALIVKKSILPKLIYRFKAILIKILAGFFGSNSKVNFKFYVEVQRT